MYLEWFLSDLVSNPWFWTCLSFHVFPVWFYSCIARRVFDCPTTATSGETTQLQRPRWSPATCSLQTLSGTHCPQEIYQPSKRQFFQAWQSVPPSSSAASSPWLPAWEATEATLLRTPQAMYVRESQFSFYLRVWCLYVNVKLYVGLSVIYMPTLLAICVNHTWRVHHHLFLLAVTC